MKARFPWWLALPALVSLALTPASTAIAAPVDHAELDRLLRVYVHNERIDYRALQSKDGAALERYLAALAEVDPAALPREERLAFYLNLYNATMIHAVIERMKDKWRPDADGFALFKAPLVHLRGRTVSLDNLEHEIIRPQFKEPRIHVALVCGARSCPPILPRAYHGAYLDSTLEQNMRRFVNDPTRNQIDAAKRTLRLSRIFDWYNADFGGKAKLGEYLSRYTPQPVTGWKIEYLPYDWSLNAMPEGLGPILDSPTAPRESLNTPR